MNQTKAEKAEGDSENILEVPVTIVNGTGVEIEALYMSGGSQEEWGDDLLGDVTMPHGTYLELTLNVDKENLTWDLAVDDTSGNSLEWYDIDISEMPLDGFGIELLWDGSEGIATAIADPSELEGDYSAADGASASSDDVNVADASDALAGSVWVDDGGAVYGFEEDGVTLYVVSPDGVEGTGSYALAAGDNGVVALVLSVPDFDMEINALLTDITEQYLEFTDVESGEAAKLTPYVE